MIEKENKKIDQTKRQIRRGTQVSGKVRRLRQTPLYRTSGNVTMATDGATYRFPNPFGAKQVTFFGIATRLTSAGFALTTNTMTVLPSNGAIYHLDGVPDHEIVITGNSGPTSIFALTVNPSYPTIPTGNYIKVSGSGDSTMVVTASASPGVDIRADLFGMAQLAPSYYFTPQSSTSVGLAGPKQKIIQSGKWFLIVDENASGATPEFRARSIETTLVNIDWPNSSTIVARAEVIDYGPDYFEVKVDLATNWFISGNFMCV